MNRLHRYCFALAPFVLLAAAVVACDDDDDGTAGTSTPDAAVVDSSATDSGRIEDAGTTDHADTGLDDAGVDAALPDLCALHANDEIAGDAGDEPPTDGRYDLIAFRAYNMLAASCEVGAIFGNVGIDPPDELGCLTNELLSVARCTLAGNLLPYKESHDGNAAPCSPDAGTGARVFLHVPSSTRYTLNDVDLILEGIYQSALKTGFTAAEAERLRQLLRTDRSLIVPDAGAADAGYSQSQCIE